MKRFIIELLVTACLITLGILLCIYSKPFIKSRILEKVKLKPGSEGFKNWLNPPITTVRNYYLFNITNPIEVVTEPSKNILHIKDTPPYSYYLKTNKNDVQWLNDNKDISYSVERLFTRHPTRFSPSSVDDTGIFVDLLRAIFRSQFGPKPSDAFYAVGGKNTFYNQNAIEQLEGFTSDLFYSMQDKMTGPNRDKYGFIYRYNGSRLYNISIQTDLMKKGQVLNFANEVVNFTITCPSHYPYPIYDGLTYPPMLFDKPLLPIFNSDFCRPMFIKFNRALTMFGGINVHEYKIKLIDINNCTNPNDPDTCVEVDKIDVSKCISETLPEETLYLSKAHFYGSNPKIFEDMKIQGFTPESDKHDSFVYFEPYSGTPIKAVFRVQLNIDAIVDPMKQAEYGSELEGIKGRKGVKRLLPIFWIDQEIDVAPEVISKLRIPNIILTYPIYIFMPLVIAISIGFIIFMEIYAKRNNQYTRGIYMRT